LGSGIYIRVGTKNKDLILECSRQEFLDWLATKIPKEVIQEVRTLGKWLDLPVFRLGLTLGLSSRFGFTLYKIKDEFEAYLQRI